MKIRTQFRITLILFSVLLIVIATSTLLTSQQVDKSRLQENLANTIAQDANDLSYLSSDYVIYRESQQLERWQSKFELFSSNIDGLSVEKPEQQAIVQDIQASKQRFKEVFDSIRLTIENAQSQSVTLATLQVSWSRMAIQSQEVTTSATRLAQLLHADVEQLNQTNSTLIFTMIGAFGAFLVVIYLQTFRRALKSVETLQTGAAIIGSGNLDFKVNETKNDEIGELARAFNQMTSNLKNVTASKTQLENEIIERMKAEKKLRETAEIAQNRAEELEKLQLRLEEKAAEIEEYACQMEDLAKERAKKLQDAERLAAIGATAGMVGHDIRNPLQTVTGEVFLAKGELANLPDSKAKTNLKENLDIIDEQTVYVNKIVSDLQDYAKPLKPNKEPTDVARMVTSVISSTRVPKNIEVEQSVAENLSALETDKLYLQRIMQNLTINAVQAMPNGGKLSVTAIRRNGETVITVEDTGEGIPEKVKDKIFSPLMTTKSKGQGFGLPVVKRLTEALGGTVTFESEVGKGTKFIITLPE